MERLMEVVSSVYNALFPLGTLVVSLSFLKVRNAPFEAITGSPTYRIHPEKLGLQMSAGQPGGWE